jgi:tetratricopeptide (TPR) repeat protein
MRYSWLGAMLLGVGMCGAWAHEGHELSAPKQEQLGEVRFAVSCNAPAQSEFNRGMAMVHSFWFNPAISSFKKVLELDPACGMADWGIALMSMGNPFAWPANPKAMAAAGAAIGDAERIGAKTERERDYISAVGIFLKDWETTDYRKRAVAFERAMEALAASYPDDDEAQILYALALDATAQPDDKTYANQFKAAEILEPMFRKYPGHPGVAHYLIHTYDYAGLAEKGLPSARAYAAIAPSVPHALHMPSHIFARVGMWKDMIDSNRASYQAARSELTGETMDVGTYDALHAMDYLVFAELQLAQDKAAKSVVDEAAAIRKVNVENFVAAYALAAIPSRFALERGDWQGAAALKLRPEGLAWNKFPQAEAVLVYARGLGAARSGDIEAARANLQRLQALKEAMIAARIAYWPSQADFQIKALGAWIALAENRNEEALQLMRAAADAEEATDKHPVTPGNVVPSRELLGEMLLAAGQPQQALIEFERSLKRDPNRFRSISGAAHAADVAGNARLALDYYSKLQALAAQGDGDRPELVQGRGFESSKNMQHPH